MWSVSFNSALITALALALALACSTPSTPADPAEPEPAPEPIAKPPPDDGIPNTPAGAKLRWYLALVNGDATVDEATYKATFTQGFIDKVPLDKFNQILGVVRPAGPYRFESIKDGATATQLVAVIALKGGKAGVYIRATEAAPHRLDGLLVRPEAEKLASWDALAKKLSGFARHAQYFAAKIDDAGRCSEISSLDPGRQLAIGSAVKLYVLLAIHQRIAAGKLAWDRELAIRDDHKSLPSGTMQTLAAGTKRSIKQFALKMISISDNTATDHLLYLAGRNRVERAMVDARHSDPKRNRPVLATREFFALKLGTEKARADYVKMSERARRRFVERKLKAFRPKLDQVAAWMKKPRDIDTIEWFANGRDLCNAMAVLRDAAGSKTGEPLREILGTNPGVGFDKTVWSWGGFKAGSEPGVMNLTWLLRHESGWYFLSMTVNDPDKLIDESAMANLGMSAIALLANEVAKTP